MISYWWSSFDYSRSVIIYSSWYDNIRGIDSDVVKAFLSRSRQSFKELISVKARQGVKS